jgi:hypothetical protein
MCESTQNAIYAIDSTMQLVLGRAEQRKEIHSVYPQTPTEDQ